MDNKPHLLFELNDALNRRIPIIILYSYDVPQEVRLSYEQLFFGHPEVKIAERDIDTSVHNYDYIAEQVKKAIDELHLIEGAYNLTKMVQDGDLFIVVANDAYFSQFVIEMAVRK